MAKERMAYDEENSGEFGAGHEAESFFRSLKYRLQRGEGLEETLRAIREGEIGGGTAERGRAFRAMVLRRFDLLVENNFRELKELAAKGRKNPGANPKRERGSGVVDPLRERHEEPEEN